ncbi:MAG: SEC-C metal-binding domain-containing protein [Myxococcota bacterium]
MAKIGRNEPCPCGSGKKYKRCCLPVHQAEQAAARTAPQPETRPRPPWEPNEADSEFEELVRLSNRVPELIEQGHLDEAEQASRELLRRFPEVSDGIERLGHVHEARGDIENAVAHYRKAAAFIRDRGAPDDEHAAWLDDLADRLDPP